MSRMVAAGTVSRATQHDLVVIGGGPAGSTAAAIAAKQGLDVLLLESGAHPRPHVGESLLPGIIPILSEMDALAAVEAAGFGPKSGATQWNWGLTPRWDLWFRDTDSYDQAWLVDRSRFDAILFDAARAAGAEVREDAVVRELIWEGDRLTGVRWFERGDPEERVAHGAFVIDASGPAALVARELSLRDMIDGLRHQASWAHFEGARHLAPPREHQALFAAGADHWVWVFPIGGGRTSIGMVALEGVAPMQLEDVLASHPELHDVLGPDLRRVGPVRRERDWSYRVERVAGPGWMLAGDASGFVDPILSTGVFLSMHAGWHAAHTVKSVLLDGVAEERARGDYARRHREMFDDMLRIVRFYYQQNLRMEDYFWESKRMLMTPETELRPQRSFMILTSGLVGNIPFDEVRQDAVRRREEAVSSGAPEISAESPESLAFVCLHLEHRVAPHPAPLFFLIEPRAKEFPALFRTTNWDLSCLAPRYGNDPISVPVLEPHLRALEACIRGLDTRPGETLAAFWCRARSALAEAARAMSPEIGVVRVFGQ